MGNIAFAIILFFNAFLGGLTVPVISLIFLDKGLSLPDLSIFLGLYSLVIIFAEVPTGILADTMGRKKIFSISLVGTILSSLFFLLGTTRILLFTAIAMAGLSRAFASGSLDALYVDHSIAGRNIFEAFTIVCCSFCNAAKRCELHPPFCDNFFPEPSHKVASVSCASPCPSSCPS